MFKLINGYYIRILDVNNWILAKKEISEETGKEYEVIIGYYWNLENAWKGALHKIPKLVQKHNLEIHEILKEFKRLEENLDILSWSNTFKRFYQDKIDELILINQQLKNEILTKRNQKKDI